MDIATLALVGVVIVVAALLSGVIERTRFPQVALFLLLGLVIGVSGFGLVDFRLDSQILETIATLGLVLVLFTDAVGVDLAEVRRHRTLVRLVLGPGTLVTAALIAVAAWALLGLAAGPAAILGAALASTDPVMMRGLGRSGTRQRIPRRVRRRADDRGVGRRVVRLLPRLRPGRRGNVSTLHLRGVRQLA